MPEDHLNFPLFGFEYKKPLMCKCKKMSILYSFVLLLVDLLLKSAEEEEGQEFSGKNYSNGNEQFLPTIFSKKFMKLLFEPTQVDFCGSYQKYDTRCEVYHSLFYFSFSYISNLLSEIFQSVAAFHLIPSDKVSKVQFENETIIEFGVYFSFEQ